MVKSLLADDVDKDQTDVMGRAALHLASGYGEVCMQLIWNDIYVEQPLFLLLYVLGTNFSFR